MEGRGEGVREGSRFGGERLWGGKGEGVREGSRTRSGR